MPNHISIKSTFHIAFVFITLAFAVYYRFSGKSLVADLLFGGIFLYGYTFVAFNAKINVLEVLFKEGVSAPELSAKEAFWFYMMGLAITLVFLGMAIQIGVMEDENAVLLLRLDRCRGQ